MYGINSTTLCCIYWDSGEISDLKRDGRVGAGCLACCGGSCLDRSPSSVVQAVAHRLSSLGFLLWAMYLLDLGNQVT